LFFYLGFNSGGSPPPWYQQQVDSGLADPDFKVLPGVWAAKDIVGNRHNRRNISSTNATLFELAHSFQQAKESIEITKSIMADLSGNSSTMTSSVIEDCNYTFSTAEKIDGALSSWEEWERYSTTIENWDK
jgi:hypothetical protein